MDGHPRGSGPGTEPRLQADSPSPYPLPWAFALYPLACDTPVATDTSTWHHNGKQWEPDAVRPL
jgi:hypothetical protein